jgi:AbrB family looped-hinge helix DNA binding protein
MCCSIDGKGGYTMETSVVTKKGQIVIPKKIRKSLGIMKGSKVAFIEKEG